MKLSELALNRSSKICEASLQHPFNQEIMKGVLKRDIFAFYLEQDRIYLKELARCMAIIASRISTPLVETFLKVAQRILLNEQGLARQFLDTTDPLKQTGLITPATLSYTNYLLRLAIAEPVEVSVAAILPCYWIYREVSLYIFENATENNTYARWIETYSGQALTLELIKIFDELASRTTETIREKMLDHFHMSACYEWHFWNDVYLMRAFDNTNIEQEVSKTSCCL